MSQWSATSSTCALLLLLIVLMTGCESSLYGWQVRTNSTELPPSFSSIDMQQQPVVLFSAVTLPALRGNETPMVHFLEHILRKVAPKWKLMPVMETHSRINMRGLAPDYTKMRHDYEESGLLDRDTLRKIGTTIGARYAFQPRLAFFTQTMTDRWSFPPIDLRMMQTRSSHMRLSLQLWDMETGELLWASLAETTMQNEALSQDPVYLEDISRATLGSIIADFLHRKRGSIYTPVNKFLNNLIQESMPEVREKAENATDQPVK